MTQSIAVHVLHEAWLENVGERNGESVATSRLHGPKGERPAPDVGAWQSAVEKIVSFQRLGDNWDGFGAKAPTHDVLVSALGLAYLLHQQGMDPPSRVVPGVGGEMDFEWQYPDGTYLDVEIVRWLFAEVMLIEPGMPAKHWTLPTE